MRAALAAGTGFNDRVAECQAAAETLLMHLGRGEKPHLLGEVSQEEYREHKAMLGAPSGLHSGEKHLICFALCTALRCPW